MKKSLFTLLLLVASIPFLQANHIVGGEIEFVTLEPGSYRINLIQYRDEAQEENDFYEDTVRLVMFSNKNNRVVRAFVLDFQDTTNVFYTNVDCQIEELKTQRVLWTKTFSLNPTQFSDEEGYYLVWERCCRNEKVVNIVDPVKAGMKYVLEVPPLAKNGSPFINSSPELNRPLSDYGCVGQFFYTDFRGVDRDGDSLAYRLAKPLNSSVLDDFPRARPKPHPTIRWSPGYEVDNMIPGSPALGISSRGLLTVRPSQKGLFVFSVVVEEWRYSQDSGKMIQLGEMQRDFQMLVLDSCTPPPPPELSVLIPGNPGFDPEQDTLRYSLSDDRCFEFEVNNIMAGEQVSFRAEPVNFDGAIDFFEDLQFTIPSENVLMVAYCAPGCPPLGDRPFVVDFIVEDDVCPLPQLDTVRLTIQVEPPLNSDPLIESIPASATLNEAEIFSFPFRVIDADNDSIDVSIFLDDILNLEDRGMSLEITTDEPGLVEGTFTWETDCGVFDFRDRQNFQVQLQANDLDTCMTDNVVSRATNLTVILPENTDPVVSLSLENLSVAIETGDELAFLVTANDADNDWISLRMEEDGFDADEVGVVFDDVAGAGTVSSGFSWRPDCDNLNLLSQDTFTFLFIADDDDQCQLLNADTVVVEVEVKWQENSRPVITSVNRRFELKVNEPFELELEAIDADAGDQITLQFNDSFRRPDSPSLQFESVSGTGIVNAVLSWTPECRLIESLDEGTPYDLFFLVYDDHCPITGQDTLKLTFVIDESREPFNNFQPPNVFTPNDDGLNDFFSLSGFADPKRNLPADNCDDAFDYISIYDRTGKTIFESASRDFVWHAKGVDAGTYYYHIRYTMSQYRGYLVILK